MEYGKWNHADLRGAAEALLNAALVEKDPEARDTMFHALVNAICSDHSLDVSWETLRAALPSLDTRCLASALLILGFSHDPKYIEAIERYRNHATQNVREAATEALAEFGARTATGN